MKITDENRKDVAKYLADYVSTEVERSMKIEGFGAWDTGDMQGWIESGLEAYESINQPKQMEIYRVYEVVVKARAFAVRGAVSEEAARQKLEDNMWSETEDITREPGYDKTVDRRTESTGTTGEPEGNISIS